MPDLEQTAIERLKVASEMSMRLYKQPLVITYSGGKDSDVLLHLAQASGIPFEVLHSHTTADAPETVYHVRKVFKRMEEKGIKCDVDYHVKPDGTRETMWNLIPRKLMPPTRLVRYCCAVLKETGANGRFIATGVRWDESASRKKKCGTMGVLTNGGKNNLILSNDNEEDRRLFESCHLKGKRVVNPIVDWKTDDILDYCQSEHINLNPLYQCGFSRVGCIGCPLATTKGRKFEFARYPQFKAMYIDAFNQMLVGRKRRGKDTNSWENGIDVFHWWMEDGVLPGQMGFEDLEEEG